MRITPRFPAIFGVLVTAALVAAVAAPSASAADADAAVVEGTVTYVVDGTTVPASGVAVVLYGGIRESAGGGDVDFDGIEDGVFWGRVANATTDAAGHYAISGTVGQFSGQVDPPVEGLQSQLFVPP